jgi:rare lipoprotein A
MLKQIAYWAVVLVWATLAVAVIDCESKIEAYEIDTAPVVHVVKARSVVGVASWYDYRLKNGVLWSVDHRTAASRTLKRYSTHTVTNIENGKSVEVYINDYGPEAWTGREIDLSSYAFSQIAELSRGLVKVNID